MCFATDHPVDVCASCSAVLDEDHPRQVQACEAVRRVWCDGDHVAEPVCVTCCAAGYPGALTGGVELDCGGDCAAIVAREPARTREAAA